MKNKYIADINDYRKYSILRAIASGGDMKITVCWMLTDEDQGSDGRRTSYIRKPDKWKCYDPELFDLMKTCLEQDNRTVNWAESNRIIPEATYYSKALTDNPGQRKLYFSDFLQISADRDLVFFDPDNGIEVQSVTYGKQHSCKYVYWNELIDTFAQGQSLLVYQHFPRINRIQFIEQLVTKAYEKIPNSLVSTLSSPNVLFLLVSQPNHEKYFKEKFGEIAAKWGSQIRTM